MWQVANRSIVAIPSGSRERILPWVIMEGFLEEAYNLDFRKDFERKIREN